MNESASCSAQDAIASTPRPIRRPAPLLLLAALATILTACEPSESAKASLELESGDTHRAAGDLEEAARAYGRAAKWAQVALDCAVREKQPPPKVGDAERLVATANMNLQRVNTAIYYRALGERGTGTTRMQQALMGVAGSGTARQEQGNMERKHRPGKGESTPPGPSTALASGETGAVSPLDARSGSPPTSADPSDPFDDLVRTPSAGRE